MNKNKKGFTLIELLAVIVILAILMVIAVPQILKVIDSSRSSAAASSIKLVKEGIKTNVTSAELLSENPFTKEGNCYLFDFDNNNENVQNLTIDNKEKTGGSIKLCDGKFEDDTLTFDGSSSNDDKDTKANLLSYALKNDGVDTPYATITDKTNNSITISNSFGHDGTLSISKEFDKKYSKIYVKGHRGTTYSPGWLNFYLGYCDSSCHNPEVHYPQPDTDFEYSFDIPAQATDIKSFYIGWAYGDFTITQWYLE